MKSSFFYTGHYSTVAEKTKAHLNSVPDFLSRQTAGSTRAAGDAIEALIADMFDTLLGDWCKEYSADFARRAMADIAYTDTEDFYCVVDVKTHRADTKFNMPNLTSVERLSRFYEDDKNIFALILVKYSVEGNRVEVTDVSFSPIEFLDWGCLTVGALGWGQIQIANSNRIDINHGFSRKAWMLSLCETMFEFYPKEVLKINERIARFQDVRSYWEHKQDVWA
ncbi:MAG: hypothetical protein OEV49_09965 [candidate division Zixibacteria bacterium]|nr:hypothetical protein [candidate division Zixibacteria bacterium]MDH4032347.1 hypothetical protein [candidate division Zixibacteria bacterium]